MPHRPLITAESLDAMLRLKPAAKALEALISAVPHVPRPGRRFNRTQELLNHVYAIDGSFGSFGLALFIDYGTGEEYDVIIDALDEIGAAVTSRYLKEGRAAIGGIVPKDEIARASLTEHHDHALHEIDLRYRKLLDDEAAGAFIRWLTEHRDRAIVELNQISP